MRIALIIERMDPFRGGRETSTAQLACALSQRGHEVTIICMDGSWEDETVKIHQLIQKGALKVNRLKNFITAAGAEITSGKYNVSCAMLPVPGASVYQLRSGTVPAQILASKRKCSMVGELAASVSEPFNFSRGLRGKMELRTITDEKTWCLAGSEMVAKELHDNYGRTKNVCVVFNAVDIPDVDETQRDDWRKTLRTKLGAGPKDPVFLTAATNYELKGISQLIDAFAKWQRSQHSEVNGRLVILGRENSDAYERLTAAKKIASQVIFPGRSNEIFQWYSAADTCILLSWYDPCSRVILEAVRWSLPTITTTHNGAAEMLTGGAGLVVESPKDEKGIILAMNAMADTDRRADCSDACKKIADKLTIERHVDELEDVFRQIYSTRDK